MEHIKIKSRIHILKRTGWAILLVSMILAGGIRAQDTFSSRDPKVYAWWGTIYPEFCFEKVEDNGEDFLLACESAGLVIQYSNE